MIRIHLVSTIKAIATGLSPGGCFVFGVLAGMHHSFVWSLLGLTCVVWLSFVVMRALRTWQHVEHKREEERLNGS